MVCRWFLLLTGSISFRHKFDRRATARYDSKQVEGKEKKKRREIGFHRDQVQITATNRRIRPQMLHRRSMERDVARKRATTCANRCFPYGVGASKEFARLSARSRFFSWDLVHEFVIFRKFKLTTR